MSYIQATILHRMHVLIKWQWHPQTADHSMESSAIDLTVQPTAYSFTIVQNRYRSHIFARLRTGVALLILLIINY